MISLISATWKQAKENPLIAFLGGLFLTCIGYVITHESTRDKDQEELEAYYLKFQNSLSEYNKIDSSFELWKSTIRKIDSTLKSVEYLHAKEAKDITQNDILEFVGSMTGVRASLDDIIILLENAHYKNQTYTNISNDILSDAVYLDTFYKNRSEAIVLLFKNGTPYDFKNTFEGFRRFKEIDNRIAEIDKSLDEEIDVHNSLLRTAQGKEESAKFKSKLAIAAWTYVAAFIGGCLGYFSNWRKRKRKKENQIVKSEEKS